MLLWLLYPREVDYAKAADLSLRFLFAEWAGSISEPFPIPWRKASGAIYEAFEIDIPRPDLLAAAQRADANLAGNTDVPVETYTRDLSGGFYTEGEVGPVKVTQHVAFSTAMLAWSLLEFPAFWGAGGGSRRRRDALTLVRHGMDHLLACYIPVGTPAGWPRGVEAPYSPQDQVVYLVRGPRFFLACFAC